MSIATRCPSCGTVFRVVSDQLKVSEGWVRCGRCSEVFNAGQRLFELDPAATTAPVVPPPAERPLAEVHHLPLRDGSASPAAARVSAALAPAAQPDPVDTPLQTADEPPAAPEAEPPPQAEAEPAPEAAASATSGAEAEPSPPDQPDTAPPAEPPPPAPAESSARQDTEAPAGLDAEPVPAEPVEAAAAAAPDPTPDFVRRADRAALWRQPSRRAALSFAALLLLALLGGQIALHYRDHVAARWPATQPGLQLACTVLGCRIEPPRHIEALNVDSSGLVRLQDSPLYRLTLVVQNKSATRVRMPAIDLSLSDGQGQTTARRVLSAAELGQAANSLPAGGEVSLQATLDLGARRVAGYTVELFYP